MIVVVARHGSQNFDTGALTAEGRAQVEALAGRLKAALPAGDIFLAYSDVSRTKETADILIGALTPKKTLPLAWLQDGELAGRRARTLGEHTPGFSVALLVTHLPVANEILGSFAREFQMDDPPKGPELAEAIVADPEAKTFTRI
ncbi:hypothetical protein EPO33_04195 [Patescibacteria group bacterium]|nr:MAG: hypothetical protein EPO33_04195 [Patescibacteria group bacterium]